MDEEKATYKSPLVCAGCRYDPEISILVTSGVGHIAGMNFTCPICGRYNVDKQIYETTRVSGELTIVASSATLEELLELYKSLAQLRREGRDVTPGQLATFIEGQGRQYSSLAAWVRDNGGAIAAASLLVTVLQLLMDLLAAPSQGLTPEQVQEIVTDVVREMREQEVPSDDARDDPCACGFGLSSRACPSTSRHGQREDRPPLRP